MDRQMLFPPVAGFVAAVPCEPYPGFPSSPLDRIRWAFWAPVRKAPAKTVLTILALHADKEGKAWPAVVTIATMASLGERAAIYAVKHLEGEGWLTVVRRVNRPSLYLPKAPTDRHCHGCGLTLVEGVTICPSCGLDGVHEMHPKCLMKS